MESKLFIALLVTALLAFTLADDGDSNGSDSGQASMGSMSGSFEDKEKNCEELVDGSDDNDGQCEFIDNIEELPDKCDECSEDEKIKIKTWSGKCKNLLKQKSPARVRLAKMLDCIQEFQMDEPECFEKIQHLNCSAGYESVATITKVVEYKVSFSLESVFTLDEDDNCPFFDDLLNGTSDSYEQESAVLELINGTLITIIKDKSISFKKRFAKIYEALVDFFGTNPEMQSVFFRFQIRGVGSFQSVFEICKSFKLKYEIDTIFEGEVEECEFMKTFKGQLTIIFEDVTISKTTKGVLMQFYNRILQQLKLHKSGKGRLSCIVKEMRAFKRLYSKIMRKYILNMSFRFGSFFELVMCSIYRIGYQTVTKPTDVVPSFSTPSCSCTCSPTTLMP